MKKIILFLLVTLPTYIFNTPEELSYPFQLPKLEYSYSALTPYIDTKTMKTHVTKHHQGYINKLNKALDSHPELQQFSLEQLLRKAPSITHRPTRKAIINSGGGHYNHTLFWRMMSPKKSMPSGILLDMIIAQFGSVERFKELFSKEAQSVFGSGWTWLCIDKNNKMNITHTPNQENPITEGLFPLLGLDLWEHAYYLKYLNKRDAYITSWWHVVNWPYVEQRLLQVLHNR